MTTEADNEITIYNIAAVKASAYCEEYNPYTGKTEDRPHYYALKKGYTEGFIAGFAHKLTGGHDE